MRGLLIGTLLACAAAACGDDGDGEDEDKQRKCDDALEHVRECENLAAIDELEEECVEAYAECVLDHPDGACGGNGDESALQSYLDCVRAPRER